MFALIFGAVRTRTAQALTVLVLTALASAAAVAGPWFASAAATRAANADVVAAPAGQRVLSARQMVATNGDPRAALDSFATSVRRVLPVQDADPVLGASLAMTVNRASATRDVSIDYRDGFCQHVRLTGTCPAGRADVAISNSVAQQLGLAVGDRFEIRASPSTDPVRLRITGRYDLSDPTGAYWSNALFRADNGLDPLFTPLETFTDRQLWQPTFAYDVGVPDALLRGDNGYDLAAVLREAGATFDTVQLRLVDPTGPLLAAIENDKSTIRLGVLVALGQVLVLGWFAIGLAGRYTGRDRRGDAALLKLRGSTRLAMLRLTFGQHLVPMLGGAVIGAPAGYLLARALVGAITVAAEQRTALGLSALGVLAVVVGGLLVLAAVEAAVLWLPVVVLLRRVPPGRRDWRADVIDALLLAVAVGAGYQARASGMDSGLGLVAPALVALAVALLLARLLGRVADRAGGAALRAGRLRFGLTAVQVSRQPGTDRVFALVVVAVAVFATAAGGWSAAGAARSERGAVELGAARVLTVQASNRTALEYAVRRADPGGKHAMAAVVDLASSPPVLAVDSSRLAAVASWRPEYGAVTTLPTASGAARLPSALPAVTGSRLVLRARNNRAAPIALTAVLQNDATGAAVQVLLGPIAKGEHSVSGPVSGCTAAPGCRLVRWELVTPAGRDGQPGAAPQRGAVTVRSLTQQDPPGEILGAAALGDVSRWRSDVLSASVDVTAADGALTMAMDANPMELSSISNLVDYVDTPLPVPIVLAGSPSTSWQFADPFLASFGQGATPVRVAGTASLLPVLGGAGVLVDLDAARRVSADAELGGALQVWLAADAPAGLVDALTAGGLTVIGDDSVAARAARLAEQGPAVAARFALLAALIGLLLAAATVAVASAVDRGPQADQLRALRRQGLTRRAAVVTGWAGTAALVVAGLLGGLIAAAVARPIVGLTAPGFTDGWRVIALPSPLGPGALAAAGLIALIVLGLTGLLSVLPLIRGLRGSGR
jgi:hypothetical protein